MKSLAICCLLLTGVSLASSQYGYNLLGRNVKGVSVPYFTPSAEMPIAFDVFPKGRPRDFTHNTGVAWIDLCSTDIEADGKNYECLRSGIMAAGDAHFGFAKGGNGQIRNLRLQVNGGNVGIGTHDSPTTPLDVNGSMMRLRTPKTPKSSTESCAPGTIAWDQQYTYVCVAQNMWKRSALSSW